MSSNKKARVRDEQGGATHAVKSSLLQFMVKGNQYSVLRKPAKVLCSWPAVLLRNITKAPKMALQQSLCVLAISSFRSLLGTRNQNYEENNKKKTKRIVTCSASLVS